MNRIMRMRRVNKQTSDFDILFPQTVTENVLRRDNGGVLENYLCEYDRHLQDSLKHLNHVTSTGRCDALEVSIPGTKLVDGYSLFITLHTDLECGPTISFNGGEPARIVSTTGDSIPGGQICGSTLFVVWNEKLKSWILINSDVSANMTRVLLPILTNYTYVAEHDDESLIIIPGFDCDSDRIEINYNQTILRFGIDYEFYKQNGIHLLNFTLSKDDTVAFTITKFNEVKKRGIYNYVLESSTKKYVVPEDGTAAIPFPEVSSRTYSVSVNYNQTILRNGIDYDYDKDSNMILLRSFTLNRDEIIIFTVNNYVETNGILKANDGGASGTYRYSVTVHRESYTADVPTVVITVPNFNHKRDEIAVIFDNKYYIEDTDYTIDEVGNIVLLKQTLQPGETIYFTILEGAMVDVPRFNVSDAYGTGKDLLVNISESEVKDFYCLMLKIPETLEDEPTLKFIDGPARHIMNSDGEYIHGGNQAGSFLYLVYNRDTGYWYSLGTANNQASTETKIRYKTGVDSFGGFNTDDNTYREVMIEHGLGATPVNYSVLPCEHPTIVDGAMTNIGDVWCYVDERYLYVGNTGKSTSKFKWTVSI